MGYAVLESTDLLYFGVHTFPHRCSVRRLCAEGQAFVQGLLDAYAPQLLVIEKTWYAKSKRSTRLHIFVEAMEGFAAHQGLLVRTYTPSLVKKLICGHGDATRRDLAETLIRQDYHFLAKYLQRDLRTRDKYWQSMFDAVALGLTGYEDVSRTRVTLPVVTQHPSIGKINHFSRAPRASISSHLARVPTGRASQPPPHARAGGS
jgi:Holliday junction resolvasome RuvABC endonuclease subunit